MKIEEVQRTNRKPLVVTIRISKEVSDWMAENKVSPTLVFNKAIRELQEKK